MQTRLRFLLGFTIDADSAEDDPLPRRGSFVWNTGAVLAQALKENDHDYRTHQPA